MNKISLNQIVLTGASGTLGRRFPRECIGLKTRLESTLEERITELKGLKVAPRVLVHLAALTVVADCEKDPQRAVELNVEGTHKWILAAQSTGIERFIHISTSHVYARPTGKYKLTVAAPLGPVNAYGRSKYMAEEKLQDFIKANATPLVCISRVFSVLASDLPPGFLYPALIERAKKKDYSPVKGLDYIRDFLSPEEIVNQILKLARADKIPALVNICSGKETSIRSVAARVFVEHGLDPNLLVAAPGSPGDVEYLVGEPSDI